MIDEFLKNFKEYELATPDQSKKELWDVKGILKRKSNKEFKFDLTPFRKFKDEEVARKINIKSKADKIVVQTNHELIILDVEELNKYVLKNKLNKIYLDDITPILEWTIIIKKKVKNG